MAVSREERQALNELFGGQKVSDKWRTKFPELGWDENYDEESLDEFTNRINSLADEEDEYFDEDDDEDEYDDEEDVTPISKDVNDIQLSVKAIILDNYKAFDYENNHKFLILKDSGSDWWDLPGGHLEDGELLADGLEREINEETGLDLRNSSEIFIKQLILGEETKPVMFYFAGVRGDVELSDEHLDYAWITLDEINDYNLGVFVDVLEEAFELLYDGELDK